MARQKRQTEPVDTLDGLLIKYEDVAIKLAESEVRGRQWLLDPARGRPEAEDNSLGPCPSDYDIRSLHRIMFEPVFEWAGKTRKVNVGPGGKVAVEWPQVATALRDFSLDLEAWVRPLRNATFPLTNRQMAHIMADAHHRFQRIHPFQDTNGRTGRVFDHFLLWVTFAQGGEDWDSTPIIEHFPDANAEDDYYEGLQAADDYSPGRLRLYYEARVEESLS